MKSIFSTLTALLLALITLPLLLACGSQQEDAISVLHHFNRGNEAYGVEDYRRAIIHFSRALELDASSPDIQYNLGLAYYRSGNYQEAVSAFTAALKARPTMIDAHFNLALAHDRLFNADAAHTHYNRYRGMVSSRAEARPGAAKGAAAASISAMGAAAGKAGGTMVNRASTPGTLTAAPNGGRTPTGQPAARGRPIPKIKSGGNNRAIPGAESQGLAGRGARGGSAVKRPPPQVRRGAAPPAYQAAPTPPQNTQNPSGDQQKWWIQDRFNRTR